MKKRMHMRMIAGVIALTTLLTSLAGCGGGKDDKEASKEKSTEVTASQGNTTKKEEPKEEVRDLKGYEFILGSHWATHYFPEPGASEQGDKMLARYAEIEKKYNCKITYKTGSPDEFVNGVNSALAAGLKYADFVDTNLWWLTGFQKAGYIVPLNEVKSIDLNDEKWGDTYTRATTHDGKTYGVNFMSWYYRIPHYFYITFFNKKILEKYSQPNPYDLLKEGKWTWEAFRDIAKACTRDENGDGKTDIWGSTGIDRNFEYSIIWSNGAREVFKDTDGKYKFGYADDKAYKAIQYARDMIQVDKSFLNLHDPRTGGQDWTLPGQEFVKGNVAFFVYHTEAMEWWMQDMEDDFGVIPFPKGPDATKWGGAVTGDLRVFSMLTTATDKESAAFIFDKITEPLEGTKINDWEDYAKRMYFRDDEGFNIYKEVFEACDYDYLAEIGSENFALINSAVLKVTRDNASTPAEAIQSIKDSVQTAIDEDLNK